MPKDTGRTPEKQARALKQGRILNKVADRDGVEAVVKRPDFWTVLMGAEKAGR